MAISLDSISRGKARKAPRILLAGVEKIGKSTWASQAPSPIFIPVALEQGLDEIDAPKFPPVQSYQELMAAIGALCETEHEYRTVVIDSASSLEPLIWARTCEEWGGVASIELANGGYGKGYLEALKYWREIQTALDYLRSAKSMGCIIVCHVKVKTFNDPTCDPYDQYQIALQDRATESLSRWADVILFGTQKVFAKAVAKTKDKTVSHATGSPERIIYTEKRPAHPGGNRYGLPYELPFNYAAFQVALDQTK